VLCQPALIAFLLVTVKRLGLGLSLPEAFTLIFDLLWIIGSYRLNA
jgi:hypothetical protein